MPIFIPSLYNPSKYDDVEIEDIADMIKTGEYIDSHSIKYNIKGIIKRLRAEKNKEERIEIKKVLPCFNLCEFGGDKKINENFVCSDYMTFDIDHFSSEEKADKVKEILKAYALFYFTSPSGDGLKFAIRLRHLPNKPAITKEIQFKQTYRQHFYFFLNELELISSEERRAKKDILDHKTSSPANAPFLSYDDEVFFNPKSFEFMVYDEFKYTKACFTSALSPNQESEAYNICRFLQVHPDPISYDDWTKIGMALSNLSNGFDCWKMIPPSDSYKNIKEADLERKYHSFKNTKITISTLYYYAIQKGYDSKKEEGGTKIFSTRFAFKDIIFKESGWYSPVRKSDYVLAFKFDSFLPEGTYYNEVGEREDLFYIDGELTPVSHKDITSSSAFKSALASKRKSNKVFLITTHDNAYNRLFEYITSNCNERKYEKLTGVGNIAKNVWNLGNVCFIDNKVVPSDNVIQTDKGNYVITPTDELEININKDKMNEIFASLPKYYPEDLAIVMGWATAQIFYQEMIERQLYLPLLFMHGSTGSGKSTLSRIILSIYGVAAKSMVKYQVSLSSKTTINAINNLRDTYSSIPMNYDEYKDQYAMEMKAYYDRAGSIKAYKTNDNRTYQKEIKSGTIVSSVNISKSSETINRCVYVRLKKITHNHSFIKEVERNMKYLSTYLFEVLNKYNSEDFFNRAEQWEEYLLENCGQDMKDSRISKNYAFVMAGWDFAKQYFNGYDVKPEYWFKKMKFVADSVEEDSIQSKFIHLLIRVMNTPVGKDLITFVGGSGGNGKKVFEYEKNLYYWVKFNFNANLWHIIAEYDKRTFNYLGNVSEKELKEQFSPGNYPKELKGTMNLTYYKENNKKASSAYMWKLAVLADEMNSINDITELREMELEEED